MYCEHNNIKEIVDNEDRIETIFTLGSRVPGYIAHPRTYYYCIDCNRLLVPIYGIGSRRPAGYMVDENQVLPEKFLKDLEELQYTSEW